MKPPLSHLFGSRDVTPPLAGNLVLHEANLWSGYSETGSQSGLHHDFHDNLYAVIQGEKVFRLLPPTAVPRRKFGGEVKCVDKNGLISYSGFSIPGPSGEGPNLQLRISAMERVNGEHKLAKYRKNLEESGDEKAEAEVAHAERMLDNALDRYLTGAESLNLEPQIMSANNSNDNPS